MEMEGNVIAFAIACFWLNELNIFSNLFAFNGIYCNFASVTHYANCVTQNA